MVAKRGTEFSTIQYPSLAGWPDGENTLLRADSLPASALRRCINYDIDDVGKLDRRAGSTRVYDGSIQPGTLYSNPVRTLFVESGHLKELVKRVDGSYSALLVRLNVGSKPMAYATIDNDIYYSNGIITGKINAEGEALPWGIDGPSSQPSILAGSGGSLQAGDYQVAVTFMTAYGEESGTGLASIVTVADGGSIQVTGLPAPTEASVIVIYCSTPNGEMLYEVGRALPGSPTYLITNVEATGSRELQTQFGCAPPAGDVLEYHKGRIFIAQGNIVWLTDPLRYGLVRMHESALLFKSKVTVMKSVDDGIYICADKTYWLAGMGTGQETQIEVLPYGAAYGTGINLPNSDNVAWFSDKGIVVGGLGGQAANLHQDRVAVPKFDSGAMMFTEFDGIRRFVATLGTGVASKFADSEYVSLEIARSGNAL